MFTIILMAEVKGQTKPDLIGSWCSIECIPYLRLNIVNYGRVQWQYDSISTQFNSIKPGLKRHLIRLKIVSRLYTSKTEYDTKNKCFKADGIKVSCYKLINHLTDINKPICLLKHIISFVFFIQSNLRLKKKHFTIPQS